MAETGVYCPFCCQWQQRKTSGKKNWCDDQWYRNHAEITCSVRGIARNCCNSCSDQIGEYYHAPIGVPLPPIGVPPTMSHRHADEPQAHLQPWRFPTEVTADIFNVAWHKLKQMPTEFWTIFHTNVCHYGHEEPTKQRIRKLWRNCGEITPRTISPLKFLSKFGAVRVRASGTPRTGVHWLDQDNGMGYIDGGNALYSFVLDWIWPGLPFSNLNTRGDIVEAILGWSFLTQKHGCQPRSNTSNEFILNLDRVLWYVYTHQSAYNF